MKAINNYQVTINNYKLLVWVGVLLFFAAPLALAQSVSPTEAMLVGNQHYEAGQYIEAVDVYETIVAAGVEDSILYYNLGNAYYKRGDLGRAILNYRRAQYLDPRDADIAANLAVAQTQTLDRFEESNEESLTNLIQAAEEWLTLGEASILALVLWLLVSAFAIMAIVSTRLRRISLWAIGVLGFFLVAGLLSMTNRSYTLRVSPPAVIVAQAVDVTSGPGSAEQYLVEFNLHSGAEVSLIESRPGWRRIALPGEDFQGWVPSQAVERVIEED